METDTAIRQIRTLFSLGRVGDRADGELLRYFGTHHAAASAAFEELVIRHGPMVMDVCKRILRDPHDASDAFQATFVVLVRRCGSIKNRDALGSWLHRVALRIALRARLDAAHRSEMESRAHASTPTDSVCETVERYELLEVLHEELNRLPARYRSALVACYLEGLTHEQAATRLRWPVGTVRSRLARGRDRLRDRLTRRGFAPAAIMSVLKQPLDLVCYGSHVVAAQSVIAHIAGHSGLGALSARVASLSERVIQAMNLSALRMVAMVLILVATAGGMLRFLPGPTPAPAFAVPASQRGESLAGIVRDSAGRPVERATVVVGAFTMQQHHQIGTTGADGRFAFESEDGDRRLTYVVAYKEGLAPASKFLSGGPNGNPSDDAVLVLTKPKPFVGVVKDRAGSPLKGVRVGIRYMRGPAGQDDRNPIFENVLKGSAIEPLFNTTTDDQGAFRFPAVPEPYRVVLRASADGMGDYSSEVPGDYEAGYRSGTAEQPAQLTMEPEARINGRIVAQVPGATVAGLTVALQSTDDSPQFWRDTKTDSDGRFAFRGLPEGGGNLFLMDHRVDGEWTYRAIDNLSLRPGKTFEATIALIEGVMVEGKVINLDTGGPAAGVIIGMYGPARPDSGAAIMSATTGKDGLYRFRLPPGKTRFYTAGGPPWSYAGQEIDIPNDVKSLNLPDLKVTPENAPDPRAPTAQTPSDTATQKEATASESIAFAGTVHDISDAAIDGAIVVGALLDGETRIDRQIVTTGADGRYKFTLRRPSPFAQDSAPQIKIYAFKEGLAPTGISAKATNDALTLVLARPRPFACLVQDHDEKPIAGADVWVESINAPVIDGQGLATTEFSRPALENTPIEAALRGTSNDDGLVRLPSLPARSQVNLIVTAPGMRTHRTTDFSRPDMTGRWPSGFDNGFLRGTSDWPATIYLEPEPEGKALPATVE